MSKRSGRIVPTLLAAAVLLALTNVAAAQESNPPMPADASTKAQDAAPTKAKNLDAVVVTGTRASNRRSEEHTSELQSLMRISYAVFCLKKKNKTIQTAKQT